jgi:hypothetical protein
LSSLQSKCRLSDLKKVYDWIVLYGEPLGLDFRFREGAPSKLHVWDSFYLNEARASFGNGEWKISTGFAEYGSKLSLTEAEERKEAAGCVKLVGVYFGNNTAVQKVLSAKLQDLYERARKLFEIVGPQEGLIIYKTCVMTKLAFKKRIHHPGVIPIMVKAEGKDFSVDSALDRMVLKSIAGQELMERFMASPGQRQILYDYFTLPKRLGGLGLRRFRILDCFIANVAGMCAAAKYVIETYQEQDVQRKRKDFFHVFPSFRSNLTNYNNAVNLEDKLEGADVLEDVQCANIAVENLIRKWGDLRGEGDAEGHRRVQARYAKKLTDAVNNRILMEFENGLSETLRRRQQHKRGQRGVAFWHDHIDFGAVTMDGIWGSAGKTLTSAQYAYLLRRELPIEGEDVHGVTTQPQWKQRMVCGRMFKSTGTRCMRLMDPALRHAECRCRGTRGGAKHTGLQNALVKLARELLLTAHTGVTIPGESVHPDVGIGGLWENEDAELFVDVTNVDSELNAGAQVSMKDKFDEKMAAYADKCNRNGIMFWPCVTSALGGFCQVTVDKLLMPIATILAEMEGLYLTQALDRVMLRLQTAILKQIATNGMDFANRHAFRLPEVVELKDQFAGGGSGRI